MTIVSQRNRDTITVPTKKSAHKRDIVALRDCLTGREFRFSAARNIVSIGGSLHCDITVQDPYASSRHCTVERKHGGWIVRDQSSKNGTLLDGTRVETAELRPGAELMVGRTRLIAVSNDHGHPEGKLVGKTARLEEAIRVAKQAARGDCSVLLLGETGTGKELFARLIHDESRVADKPFVAVNCGAIPRELVASELFGHVRGAFTGATTDHDGYFLQAEGGTIFLDEIGELPMEQQPHLLRTLEARMVRKVGSKLEQMVQVRVVAATNRLSVARDGSRLRTDLYHRLATLVIELPPLRERVDDIPLLVENFLEQLEPRYGQREVSEETLQRLQCHSWPGNIRELRNAVERAMAVTRYQIGIGDLLPEGLCNAPIAVVHDQALLPRVVPRSRDDHELARALQTSYERWGSIRKAAEALGIPKSTFADQCHRLGIITRRRD